MSGYWKFGNTTSISITRNTVNLDAYTDPMGTICEVIREHGGALTQQEFDAEFCSWNHTILHGMNIPVQTKRPFPLLAFEDDTPILGDSYSGMWGKWLDLLQHMEANGKITSEGQPPNVVYKISEPVGATA